MVVVVQVIYEMLPRVTANIEWRIDWIDRNADSHLTTYLTVRDEKEG